MVSYADGQPLSTPAVKTTPRVQVVWAYSMVTMVSQAAAMGMSEEVRQNWLVSRLGLV